MERWFVKSSPDLAGGVSEAEVVEKMTAAGVKIGLISVPFPMVRNPYIGGFEDPDMSMFRSVCERIAAVCRRHPGRAYGVPLIDPTQGMNAVREVEIAVREYGFKAVRIFGAAVNVRPNHPLCWPIYTKAIELGIPVTVNVGVPGPMRFASNQRPMDLDEVLVTYPELKLVLAHIGHPWHVESVALLQKHPNCYLMTSGWATRYVPTEVIHYLNTRGQNKVLWSADYPVQTFERCVREAHELPLRDGVLRKFMRENAMQVFGLG
jgi:predicted TIM-barrel fold metal-dependent hydrolase